MLQNENYMLNAGEVVANKKIKESIWLLKIKVHGSFIVKPGQFVNIRISDGYVPLLRRPFSVFDYKSGFIKILYKIIGEGTRKLSEKKKGDKVDFIGPVGNSYIDFFSPNETTGKDIYLIAGGTGFASVHFFAQWLSTKKIKFKLFYGARDKKEVLPVFCEKIDTLTSTDDGSFGKKGMVTDFLKKENTKNKIIFCCGPKPMLQEIQNINAYKKIASFESYMGCANGVCLSCVIKIKNNNGYDYVRVCKEGTVFDMDRVIF